MSYYSDIKLITTPKGWAKIQTAVRHADPDHWDYVADDSYAVPICAGKYILVEINQVKWDTNNPGVAAFMKTLDDFYDKEILFDYINIGEDWDDNVQYRCYMSGGKFADDMPTLTIKREIEVMY